MSIKVHESRQPLFEQESMKPYFLALKEQLIEEKKQYTIYPSAKDIFAAFDMTPLDNVKVVLLWQDPYHGPWQAMWLSFSVPDDVPLPPSLKNIYKEIESDIGSITKQNSWNLTHRAEQWVLLLNAFLTVRAWQPASHQKLWWEYFTDAIIKHISDTQTNVVFLLRWNFARSKQHLIDQSKHLILQTVHPSPFSVHNGFFGCKHFTKTNEYLKEHWKSQIVW